MSCEATVLAVGEQRDGGRNAYMQLFVLTWYPSECQSACCYYDPTYQDATVSVRAGLDPQIVRQSLCNSSFTDCPSFGGIIAKLSSTLMGPQAPPGNFTEDWELDPQALDDAYLEQAFSGGTGATAAQSNKKKNKKSKNAQRG